jgi:hypothetical protein
MKTVVAGLLLLMLCFVSCARKNIAVNNSPNHIASGLRAYIDDSLVSFDHYDSAITLTGESTVMPGRVCYSLRITGYTGEKYRSGNISVSIGRPDKAVSAKNYYSVDTAYLSGIMYMDHRALYATSFRKNLFTSKIKIISIDSVSVQGTFSGHMELLTSFKKFPRESHSIKGEFNLPITKE